MPIANAFATGRNPTHASVVLTQQIIDLLTEDELRGVLSHELSHIKNRDVLVTTMAATLATAIGYIANMLQYSAFWGTLRSSNSSDRNSRSNPSSYVTGCNAYAYGCIALTISSFSIP